MYMLVKKAMYGLIESAMLWQIDLEKTLIELGLKPSKCDGSTYHDSKNTSILTHVDDIFILGSKERIEEVKKRLEDKYNTKEDGVDFEYLTHKNEIDFLATKLKREDGDIIMHRNEYIDKILKENRDTFLSNIPATSDLITVNVDSQLLNEKDKTEFKSLVMKLMYAGQ